MAIIIPFSRTITEDGFTFAYQSMIANAKSLNVFTLIGLQDQNQKNSNL
jgi:hypothetical protein